MPSTSPSTVSRSSRSSTASTGWRPCRPRCALTADVFGREKSGLVFGWIFTAHQLGAATAAFGAGAIRTDTGNYMLAFMISGAFCLLAAVMVLGIGRKPLSPIPAIAE